MILKKMHTQRLTLSIERRYPRLRDRLLTALEFSGQEKQRSMGSVSQMLAQGLEKEMTSLLSRFTFTKVASFGKLVRPIGLIILVLGFSLLLHWLDRCQRDCQRTGHHGPSRGNTIGSKSEPVVRRAVLERYLIA